MPTDANTPQKIKRVVAVASAERGAKIVPDRPLLQKLWRPEVGTRIPGRLDYDDLVILRVDLDHAEIWD
jgi:general stress protein 26